MKKLLSYVGQIVLSVLLIPVMLLVLLGFLLYTPFDYIAYKRSSYCRDFGVKYRWLLGLSPNCRLYDAIQKMDLPIEYLPVPDEAWANAFGYFYHQGILILPDVAQLGYDRDANAWIIEENDAEKPIADFVQEASEGFLKSFGGYPLKKVVILLDKSGIPEEEVPIAEGNALFVLYNGKKDLGSALKRIVHDSQSA
ncbi:MAG: hypothetical protein IJ422_01470 [Oscillospiraceae bacterium]|nr:hypothetical protein [Oscillospiraceae bacterium]